MFDITTGWDFLVQPTKLLLLETGYDVTTLTLATLTVLILGLLFMLRALLQQSGVSRKKQDAHDLDPQTGSASQDTFDSSYGVYEQAAVAADSKICSDIGRDIMQIHGGNAIDAAIATALASTVIYPHSTSIGGGFFATVYHKEHGWHTINARETAPLGIKPEMFSTLSEAGKTKRGCTSICVPGLIKGLYEMSTRFGSLPWRVVIEPSIKLLRDGFPIEKQTYYALVRTAAPCVPGMKGFEVYLDAKGHVKPPGSIVRHPVLAKTLEEIARDPMSFYDGPMARDLVQDIQDAGGLVTLQDFQNYEAVVKPTLQTDLPGDFTVHSGPPPAGGAGLNYILSIMAGFNLSPDSVSTHQAKVQTLHRFLEASRFAMAMKTRLGDPAFVDCQKVVDDMTSRSYGDLTRKQINDDMTLELDAYGAKIFNYRESGTSHCSVLDPEGNAVAITGSICDYFGSLLVSKRTGVNFNNSLGIFTHLFHKNFTYNHPDATMANLVHPGKRPISAICPAIVWDNKRGRVCLVTGAAGDQKIMEGVAKTIADVLYFHQSVPQTLDQPKVYQELMPPILMAEDKVPKAIKEDLESKGHNFIRLEGFTVIQMIHVQKTGEVVAGCDYRKGGQPSGF